MTDPSQKSRERFRGKRERNQSPLRNFTLYLDESFDCGEVKSALASANIKYKVFTEHFPKGAEDPEILKLCGRRGWAMLTRDRKNRYRQLERKMVLKYKVRQFVFSGNLGAERMAQLLVGAYQRMRDFARNHDRPFVANVTVSGDIYLRMDSNGNVTDWEAAHGRGPHSSRD